MKQPQEITLLIVDDDDIGVASVQRAMRKLGMSNPVRVGRNGLEALEQLQVLNDTPGRNPCLVLLDLNMPRMNGLEFLAELRSRPELAHTIVFVLTTSEDPADVANSNRYNVAGYVVKKNAYQSVLATVEMLQHYLRIACPGVIAPSAI
ncbi:response regulator [Pseudophaeobacter sp.]|jgi:CheY-like chemotaxis protein|uniref:Response regulator n=1 Tax=Pseudophaeobacter arcticus TaxID=385492 RepID=A0ABQ0AI15_9RHOB|nr:response regulator [Pseudophaeobacter sp.]